MIEETLIVRDCEFEDAVELAAVFFFLLFSAPRSSTFFLFLLLLISAIVQILPSRTCRGTLKVMPCSCKRVTAEAGTMMEI